MAESLSRAARWLGRRYRTAVIAGRWAVVAGWVGLAVLLSVVLPADTAGGGGDIGDLLPPNSPAVAVQERVLEQFQVPVLSETTVVVHDPNGLSALTRADVALWALSFVQASQQGLVPPGSGRIVAAVPVPTSTPNTAVTYLYVSPGTLLTPTVALAQQYAAHFHNQSSVQTYVTGVAPAQLRQGFYLLDRLQLFEFATLALIAVVVGIALRSFVAPFAVLAVAGLGYLVAIRILGVLAASLGFALPAELSPLLAALLIGVVTDYCVLFFFGFRDQLERGRDSREAVARAVTTDAPIVAIAGLTVAAGTAALVAANFNLFKAFGPAMSLTVLVGLVVSLTLVPALMAILGPRLFLPWRRPDRVVRDQQKAASRTSRLIRIVADRRGALVATAVTVGLLFAAAVPLTQMRLNLSFSSGLPADDPVQRGAQVLDGSGIRGVTAPTEVLIEGAGVASQREALNRMQELLQAQPGVATVLGPAQNPLPDTYGIVLSTDGAAARFIVILDSDPLAADAIAAVGQLSDNLDGIAQRAGLRDVQAAVTGQTAIAAELAVITRENLWITLLAALAVELVILVAYLRAIPAPVVLLACSALGVAAALGLTVLVFQGIRGDPGLTFYVPFATAVLLLALGSDYNVFTVGSIWEQAARYPLSTAIARAMPATSRAVGTAGVILAATFGMVAIIQLETFRQVAFTMTAGLLIDTFLIRPVLTPAVLTLLGSAAGWPSHRVRTSPVPKQELQ
ncbi:MAG TPA: MMPL family transporter, partial [Mycobacterium sp.]